MGKLLAILLSASLLVSAPKPSHRGYIALTFDDGPSGAITQSLLEGLEKRRVKATFFLCNYRMEEYPHTLEALAAAGHELGLHGCSHEHMDQMTKAEVLEDLENCQSGLMERTGVAATLFRPPGGRYSEALLEASEEAGCPVILWSVDPQDWQPSKTGQVLPYLRRHTKGGDVILLHDLYPSSVEAALCLVDELQAQGYGFCTVSELAAYYGTTLRPGRVYHGFLEKKDEK